MQRYAITDRRLFASCGALVEQAAAWAACGLDYIQIREKDLDAKALEALASAIVRAAREAGSTTRVLLNGPAKIALAAGCDGIHLPSNLPEFAIDAARAELETALKAPIISISCHTITEIEAARDHGATLALFAPVFEKRIGDEILPGQELDALAAACRSASPMPVFALGGVTMENALACIAAGAAGIAAIRLFTGMSS